MDFVTVSTGLILPYWMGLPIRYIHLNDLVSDQVSDQVSPKDITQSILEFCVTEKSKQEICSFVGYKNLTYFTRKYLKPLILNEQLKMTVPNKPNSKNQRYIATSNK